MTEILWSEIGLWHHDSLHRAWKCGTHLK